MYSTDGTTLKHTLPKSEICPTYTNFRDETVSDCSFYYVTTDGHKYVWASVMGGAHRLEAYDMKTGEYVGQIPTCSTPLVLNYHATRREIWARCAGNNPEDGHEGYIDVVNVDAIGINQKQVEFNATGRFYGHIAVHSGLGDVGYITVYNKPTLYKFHLSTKEEIGTIDIPDAHAAYDMVYSPANGHLFFRARVCCTCGSEEADQPNCGRGEPSEVEITTGPNA